MFVLYLLILIPVLYLVIGSIESYQSHPWYRQYRDYFSGSREDCDNGCCDPVICSLKGKCQWRYNQNTYGGDPAMCQDFRNCLQSNSEKECVDSLFFGKK